MKRPFLIGVVLFAAVRPASVFTDGAVLQANRPVPVWGMADPGERVLVNSADLPATPFEIELQARTIPE